MADVNFVEDHTDLLKVVEKRLRVWKFKIGK
jgi:hypothetical protein